MKTETAGSPSRDSDGENHSLPESYQTVAVPHAKAGFWRQWMAFSGPAILISVGYMDPGNWGTDLAGGARFKYGLLWVVALASFMAVILQVISARLGVATGKDLAQCSRDFYPRWMRWPNWITMEIAVIATDLAESLGSAVALNLLFNIPISWAIVITAFDVVLLLSLQGMGMRMIEAVVGVFVLTIGVCYGIEIFVLPQTQPVFTEMAGAIVRPDLRQAGMMVVAIGMIGATVMPHNLYLHSSIVQTRAYPRTDRGRASAIRYATVDSTVSLMLAFFINASILILSAASFYGTQYAYVADISDAYQLLTPVLGAGMASTFFAVALLASGQNSTLTGTLAGQIVMEGFLNLRFPGWLRRLVTRLIAIIPAVIVTAIYGGRGTGELLVLSQVILSLQLSFAVVPLVMFTSDKAKMGRFVNPLWLSILAWTVTAVIVALNGYLLTQTVIGWIM